MHLRAISAAVLLVASAGTAHAGLITQYTDRPTFDAAVGPTVLEDFTPGSAFPINSGVLNQFTNEAGLSPGDIEAGVTYSVAIAPGAGNFFNIDSGGGYDGGFLDNIDQGTAIQPLDIVFDSPVAAFGFDTNQLMGSDFDILINFAAGPSFAQTIANPGGIELRFFGFQSSLADITSVQIEGGGFSNFGFALDNFAFGGSTVPAPAPLALVAAGLLALGARRRRAA